MLIYCSVGKLRETYWILRRVPKVCGSVVGTSNFTYDYWPLDWIENRLNLLSNCKSRSLSFQVLESKLICRRYRMSK